MNHGKTWRKERYKELSEDIPILLRLIQKLPNRTATFKEIKEATGLDYPEFRKIIVRRKFQGGISGEVYTWYPETDTQMKEWKNELGELEKEFSSFWSKVNIRDTLVKIITGIIIGIAVGIGVAYFVGLFGLKC